MDKQDVFRIGLFVDTNSILVYQFLKKPVACLTTHIKLFTIIEERFTPDVRF